MRRQSSEPEEGRDTLAKLVRESGEVIVPVRRRKKKRRNSGKQMIFLEKVELRRQAEDRDGV